MAAALEDEVLVDVQEEEEEDPEEVEPWYPSSDSEPEPPTPSLALPSPEPEQQQQQPSPMTPAAVVEKKGEGEEPETEAGRPRWPGWPGTSVFRLVVPADKVGAVIGRRGEAVQRLCHETRARVRILDAAHDAASRIVLVSATEEVESELPPAMNAAIKIFKHTNEIEEINSDGTLSASAPEICSVRLLVPCAQAVHLIGKQGVTIKSIQESTGATIRILDEDEVLSVESVDERIVYILGAPLKVHNALKSVLEVLRKFLVDHGVLHLFERKIQGVAQPLDTSKENQVMDDYPLAVNRNFLLSEQRSHGNLTGSRPLYGYDPSFYDPYTSDITHATDSLTQQSHGNPEGSGFLRGHDPSSRDLCSPDLRQSSDSLITEVTQTMQIPFAYAEEIIGVSGKNIEFIRSASGAIVVLEEIGDCLEEVLLMIKGSHSQVQTAHQLVQEVLSSGNREPPSRRSYWNVDAGTGLSNSPCVGPRLLHQPPHVIATSRDYLPWRYEDQPHRDHWRYPSHQGHRGYLP